MKQNLYMTQLFEAETSTYTYILADQKTKEAVIIDPVLETVDRDEKLLNEMGFKLKYILDTHVHADHVTGAGELRSRTNAKTCVSADAGVDCVDQPLQDGEEVQFGEFRVKAISTPGHTDSCMSYYCEGMIFTGDALMIRSAGRTDFQQGSPEKLYRSITQKLYTLPSETEVYPGHDYRGFTKSSIALEKQHNPRIGVRRTQDEFVKIMNELKLANPKKIHEAVPANLLCGRKKDQKVFHPQMVDGVPEITVEDLQRHAKQVRIIDVRRDEEFNNELGHIQGAELITLGADLMKLFSSTKKDEEIVFVCRSGARSANATAMAKEAGFTSVVNMQGGMIRWNEAGFPVERK